MEKNKINDQNITIKDLYVKKKSKKKSKFFLKINKLR
jgi:hypothetical protein